MKLLIITQKVDRKDPILGFFHRWVEEFSKHFDKVTVICLEKGEYNLAENVRVLSLGKESRKSRLQYVLKFYKYIVRERGEYDRVFVHMNQEYMLLGGLWWRVIGKKAFMWRLHPRGNWLTDIACFLSHKVFTSSAQAYVYKNKNTVVVPVGIDLLKFKPSSLPVESNKILIFGRVAPIKGLEHMLCALEALVRKNVDFEADIVGDALPKDKDYYEFISSEIRRLGLSKYVRMLPSISPEESPKLYSQYKLFINLTPDGSLDKTILEALSSGLKVVTSNSYFKDKLPENWVVADPHDAESLAHHIKMTLNDFHGRSLETQKSIVALLEKHRLERVIESLVNEMKK